MASVMVTGGSRGIGAAAVARFAARGDRVCFLYRDREDAARAVAARTGAVPIRADVADGQAVAEAFRQAGEMDILVCCAGICCYGLIQQTPEETWDRLFDVNVKGVYHCVRAVLPGFLRRQAGSIVTVGSMWGQTGASCEAAYSATKGAVIALTQALAKELGPSNIRVNCVAPGVIDTDMCAGLDNRTREQLRQDTPLGRLGRPEEVAQAIVALADAPFVTGQVLGVSGGYQI